MHCVLENGLNLHVNKRQTIRHYHARSTEELEERRMLNLDFFTSHGVYVNYAIIAILYTHLIENQL